MSLGKYRTERGKAETFPAVVGHEGNLDHSSLPLHTFRASAKLRSNQATASFRHGPYSRSQMSQHQEVASASGEVMEGSFLVSDRERIPVRSGSVTTQSWMNL